MTAGTFQLSVQRGPKPNRQFLLDRDSLIIGRDIDNDIVVDDPEVSRHHCRLTWHAPSGAYQVDDLGSTNGTFVNGTRVRGTVTLAVGDVLGMGETVRLSVELTPLMPGEASSLQVAGTPGTDTSGKRYQLLMREGPVVGEMHELTLSLISLGRSVGNNIVINNENISRYHCTLTWSDAHRVYAVEDLMTANGTFVNGEPVVEPRVLLPGDMLSLGGVVNFEVQLVEPTVRAIAVPDPAAPPTEQDEAPGDTQQNEHTVSPGGHPLKQRRVFISYSRKDDRFAHRLAVDLRDSGFVVWLDLDELSGGQVWTDQIENALRACDLFVAVLSPDAMESIWVKKEITMALNLGKQIVPVMVRSVDIPLALIDIQYIDFRRRYNRALKTLFDVM